MRKVVIAITALFIIVFSAIGFAASLKFSDVASGSVTEKAATYLSENGIISGYADGTFRPGNKINRAEFLKIVMLAAGKKIGGSNCFQDIHEEWYAPYVCGAYYSGLINGYADGYFRPDWSINFAEAAKIVVNAMNIGKVAGLAANWYQPYVDGLENKDVVPLSVTEVSHEITRGEMAELLWRILANVPIENVVAHGGGSGGGGGGGDDDSDDDSDDDDSDDADDDDGGDPSSENSPLAQIFPSAHVLYHYYCPDCSNDEKEKVATCGSIVNYGGETEFERMLEAFPAVANLVSLRYRLVQYVQFMTLDGVANPTGVADLADLETFAEENDYELEDFFLHFSENTEIQHLGAKVVYDGVQTVITDTEEVEHELGNDRAVAIVWGDFYYVYDWHFEGWKEYIKARMESELNENISGDVFDGYFEDVFNGPISDTYQGIVYGGGIEEFGGATPSEISAAETDHDLLKEAQEYWNSELIGKVFMPNSGNYTQDWALETMLAGDGTITESVNYPGSTFWQESWENAKAVAAAEKYYSLGSSWSGNSDVPDDYDAGFYSDSAERLDLQTAAFYWMAYEPGYVAFDYGDACCNYVDTWPLVMETDIGEPASDVYLADSGTLENGWNWILYARDYSGAWYGDVTVYYRGNNAWRDGNDASIGMDVDTAASFSLPVGSKLLKSDGTWVDAPATIDHMESFGFVVKKAL